MKSERKRLTGRPRVALIFWEGYLGVAPSLLNAARSFAARGTEVDLVTRSRSDGFAAPPDLGPLVFVHTIVDRPWSRKDHFSRAVEFVWKRLRFLWAATLVMSRRRYLTVVGVDLNGVALALPLALWKRTSVVHWSLEINDSASAGLLARLSSSIRRRVHKGAAITVVQDEHRASLLSDLFDVDRCSMVLVPNAPMGPAYRGDSTLLAQRLGIPRSRRIALHIGMVSDTVMSKELAAAAGDWSEEWLLVFHERQQRASEDPYLEEVRAAGGASVHLSLDPVPYDLLDPLVASADVGLLLYDVSAGLTYSMPGSSGKLGQYLKCGLPVVSLELPGVKEIIETWGCGVCVESVGDIGSALSAIELDREGFRNRAFQAYEQALEFSRHFEKLDEALWAQNEVGPDSR